ncbi:winged helix-turn-helix transcriptional regulator [Halobaculum gomorrense]|nr:winged helix-turn-helix transcriptional regulator [Halobaculum gomorrense]
MSTEPESTSDGADDPSSTVDARESPFDWRAARATLDLIGRKWHLSILDELLAEGPRRFSEFEERLDGVSATTLSDSLGDLEGKGLVAREVRDTRPVSVRYALTERGRSLDRVVESLKSWGRANVCTKRLIEYRHHPEIVYRLLVDERLYFSELQEVTGVPNKSLADSLERLDETDIVRRSVEDAKPVRVSYSLTERGRSLAAVLGSLASWSRRESAECPT